MKHKKFAATLLITTLLLASLTTGANASLLYFPDVSEPMTSPSYWSARQAEPDKILATRSEIENINAAGIAARSKTTLMDLRNESATSEYYNATKQTALKNAGATNLSSLVNKAHHEDDSKFTQAECDAILGIYPTGGAAPAIQSKFAIVTKHTDMLAYPTHLLLGTMAGDNDDDDNALSALRVNEPLVVLTATSDGNFYLCKSLCMDAAWVPAEDVAICANKDEWLSAWDIPEGKELVVTGYKVRTEQTNELTDTADRMLYMGTVLERIDWDDAKALVGTRSAYYNHVAYLPVRDNSGNYSKQAALIAQTADVSEGFLPLTGTNISKQAFKALGQMYGWGGMLEANDCSGYVRDIYKCFGFELPRNTTWQQNMPVAKYDMTVFENDDAHKAAAIAAMPLGTVLFFPGHEMMYLGTDNGKQYVISALGSIGDIYGDAIKVIQIKSVSVNTLDMIRKNRSTWLRNITAANIPYMDPSAATDMFDIAFYKTLVSVSGDALSCNGQAQHPGVAIPGLTEGTDYTVTFPESVSPGSYTYTISGAGKYYGQMTGTYTIMGNESGISLSKTKVTLSKKTYKYNGKIQRPTVKRVSLKGKKLKENVDYVIGWSDPSPVDADKYTVKIIGIGAYAGEKSAVFEIKKINNPMKVKSGKTQVSLDALAGSAQTLDVMDMIKFTKPGMGDITFTKASGKKEITIDPTGHITLPRGLKKGTYSLGVKVKAAGDVNHKPATKRVNIKIVVK